MEHTFNDIDEPEKDPVEAVVLSSGVLLLSQGEEADAQIYISPSQYKQLVETFTPGEAILEIDRMAI